MDSSHHAVFSEMRYHKIRRKFLKMITPIHRPTTIGLMLKNNLRILRSRSLVGVKENMVKSARM